jgi:hypothetical protein
LSEGGSLPTNLQQVTLQTVAYNAPTCTPSMADWHVQLCAGVSGGGKGSLLNLFFQLLFVIVLCFFYRYMSRRFRWSIDDVRIE